MNPDFPFQEVFLNPGEFFFGEGKIRVATILGSCISITLWHALRRHGGICHFMLDSRGVITDHLDGKYADEAVEMFKLELNKHKTHPGEYVVKVFGGGNMFSNLKKENSSDIGRRNIEAAHHLLDRSGFKIHSEHTGRAGHRRLLFDLWNGDVWLKFHDTEAKSGSK
jgi:chemotaxis protein CheD